MIKANAKEKFKAINKEATTKKPSIEHLLIFWGFFFKMRPDNQTYEGTTKLLLGAIYILSFCWYLLLEEKNKVKYGPIKQKQILFASQSIEDLKQRMKKKTF